MKYLRALFISSLLIFPTMNAYSQRYANKFFDYADGAPFLALSAINIERANPTLGLYLGFETGGANLKFAFSILANPVRAKSEPIFQTAHSLTGGSDIQVACDSRVGVFNFGLNMRYYFLNTEETVGSNFYAGAGIGLGNLSRKIVKGFYDASAYKLDNQMLDAFGSDISNTSIYNVILSAGYEYSFDSGFAIIAGLNYNYAFSDNVSVQYTDCLNVLAISTGIKYTFLIDFQNMGGIHYRGF